MTINTKREDTTLTLEIEGRIDTQTAPEMQEAVDTSLEGVTLLVLDLTKVFYISSAGLRVVAAAQNYMDEKGGEMIIRGADKNIVNLIKVTGFDTFLTLE